VGVVHALEVVHVEHHEGEGAMGALRPRDLPRDRPLPRPPVREVGELVRQGPILPSTRHVRIRRDVREEAELSAARRQAQRLAHPSQPAPSRALDLELFADLEADRTSLLQARQQLGGIVEEARALGAR
jgi:hypothetical protein